VIKFAAPTLLLLLLAPAVTAQDANAFRCVATVYRLRGERWKLIRSIDVRPSLQEEELTNKRIHLGGGRYLFASVFPTDESMNSARGPDSLKMALAISTRRKANALDLPNNAVAEATLAMFDTLRVERTAYVAGRLRLTRFECWNSDLTKKT
jgi:hypothetical protein